MSATRYLEISQRGHANGWSYFLETVAGVRPRWEKEAATLREFTAGAVYRAAVAGDAAAVKSFASRVEDVLPAACAHQPSKFFPDEVNGSDGVWVGRTIEDLGFAGWVNLLACCGAVDHSQFIVDGLQSIRTNRHQGPAWHFAKGFAGLAFGIETIYRPIAGYDSHESIEFQPGETVGHNNQRLLAHLGGAVEHDAGFADVRPAWEELVGRFDLARRADELSEDSLFWIARVVHHHIGGEPLASVGDFVHQSFAAVAAVEARSAAS